MRSAAHHSRSARNPSKASPLENELCQALGIVAANADHFPAQRKLHAIAAPDVVDPAAAGHEMNAPAVDDFGTVDLDACDIGVAKSLASEGKRAKSKGQVIDLIGDRE